MHGRAQFSYVFPVRLKNCRSLRGGSLESVQREPAQAWQRIWYSSGDGENLRVSRPVETADTVNRVT